MRKRLWGTLIILSLAFQLSACSSSEKKEDGTAADGEAALPVADAGTDAVPQPGAEANQAAGVAATDPAATPPTDGSTPSPAPTAADNSAASPAPMPPMDSSAPSTSTSSASSTGNTTSSDYTVQPGDTLMKIAFETYGDVYKWKDIFEANKDKISDPKSLKKGDVLKLDVPASQVSVERNGEKYLIKDGDTLGKISGEIYGTPAKWKELWENNKQLIHDPNKIFAGFYLYYLANGTGTNMAAAAPVSQDSNQGQASGQLAPQQAGSAPPAPQVQSNDLNSAAAAMSAATPSQAGSAQGAPGATQ